MKMGGGKETGSCRVVPWFHYFWHTKDQPTLHYTTAFLYSEDLAIIAEGTSFENLQRKLESALNTSFKMAKSRWGPFQWILRTTA